MKVLAVFLLVGCALATPSFQEWMAQHKKVYADDAEASFREAVFESNLLKIHTHNAQNHGWRMAVNKFADLTAEEFSSFLKLKPQPKSGRASRLRATSVPASVDWVKAGKVTAVETQGQCGSCWAFTAIAAVEGSWAMKHPLVALSAEELLDCDNTDQGCNGGLMDNAFQWIINNGGICSKAAYPDDSTNGTVGTCESTKCKNVAHISSYVDVTPPTEAALKLAVAKTVVAAGLCAENWQFYASGVFNQDCEPVDHSAAVVGYGVYQGTKYWNLKNSWGEDWGMNGYILIQREFNASQPGGLSGIATIASYAVV